MGAGSMSCNQLNKLSQIRSFTRVTKRIMRCKSKWVSDDDDDDDEYDVIYGLVIGRVATYPALKMEKHTRTMPNPTWWMPSHEAEIVLKHEGRHEKYKMLTAKCKLEKWLRSHDGFTCKTFKMERRCSKVEVWSTRSDSYRWCIWITRTLRKGIPDSPTTCTVDYIFNATRNPFLLLVGK